MSELHHDPVGEDTLKALSETYGPLFDGEEKLLKPVSGGAVIAVPIFSFLAGLGTLIGSAYALEQGYGMAGFGLIVGLLLFVLAISMTAATKRVGPSESAVYTLFGRYYGTMKEAGLYVVHPFASATKDPTWQAELALSKKKDEGEVKGGKTDYGRVSLKVRALNNERQKVNDLLGNPVVLETVVFWRVVNPTKALFNVDNYEEYLSTQCDSVVRNIARLYPYENLDYDDVEDSEKTLMGSSLTIADEMKRALREKAEVAGIEVEEVRISHLAYSEEIAAAMLQRQQASAVVSARSKIVDGAVGMVEMALDQLDEKHIVNLDEERKAQMVSNLLVVLCASKEISPVVNSGSIY